MSSRVFALLLIYSRAHMDSSRAVLNPLLGRLFKRHKRTTRIIENQWIENGQWALDASTTIFPGDNRMREFSGWDIGLRGIIRDHHPQDDDVIVLANDTFHRNYGVSYLHNFRSSPIRRELKANALIGWVDGYPRSAELLGYSFRTWVRTSLVISTYKTIRKLLPLAVPLSELKLFSDDQQRFFHPQAGLSENYAQYLRTWLFSDDNDGEFKEAWHSKTKMTAENTAAFRTKAQCIMCEHLLSARAQKMEIPIYDVRSQRRVNPNA